MPSYFRYEDIDDSIDPAWILLYSTADVDHASVIAELCRRYPGVNVFGTTSFQGVLTPNGFQRGAHLLIGEKDDRVQVRTQLCSFGDDPKKSAQAAALALMGTGKPWCPDVILLHATPGSEEAVIAGIDEVFGGQVPIYGGGSSTTRPGSAKASCSSASRPAVGSSGTSSGATSPPKNAAS